MEDQVIQINSTSLYKILNQLESFISLSIHLSAQVPGSRGLGPSVLPEEG